MTDKNSGTITRVRLRNYESIAGGDVPLEPLILLVTHRGQPRVIGAGFALPRDADQRSAVQAVPEFLVGQ